MCEGVEGRADERDQEEARDGGGIVHVARQVLHLQHTDTYIQEHVRQREPQRRQRQG